MKSVSGTEDKRKNTNLQIICGSDTILNGTESQISRVLSQCATHSREQRDIQEQCVDGIFAHNWNAFERMKTGKEMQKYPDERQFHLLV